MDNSQVALLVSLRLDLASEVGLMPDEKKVEVDPLEVARECEERRRLSTTAVMGGAFIKRLLGCSPGPS